MIVRSIFSRPISRPVSRPASRQIALSLSIGTLALSGGLLPVQMPLQTEAFAAELTANAALQTQPAPLMANQPVADLATPEEILAEINRMRQSPQAYATWLATLRQYYDGEALRIPGERGIRTVEGVAALDGAISALSSRQAVPAVSLAPGLMQSTRGHLDELLSHHRFTLTGLDGSTPLARAEQYGSLQGGRLNELLNEGFSSAAIIVASLIIDDGNRSRSTQDALLNAEITQLGMACSMGADSRPLCVIDYATQYETYAETAPAPTPQQASAASPKASIESERAIAPEIDSAVWFGEPNESQLTTLADELIAETNLLRANPAAYAQKLIRLRPYYEANLVRVPGHPVVEVTEGVAALDEAIAVLQNTPSLGTLSASKGMAQGANDHAEDLGFQGITGHYGSDGSDPFVRINRYGSWDNAPGNVAGENITYGQATLAEWHIIQLLVDDNVPSRGHRDALLKPNYGRVGSACEAHPAFRIVCVMTYASDYQEGR